MTRLTHGHKRVGAQSPTYSSWVSMRSRVAGHPDYVARGITCCERWKSFENFLADMGERPCGTTLERKDNAGNYEPGNCKWATRLEQSRNRRGRRMVIFQGQEMILAEAIERSGVSARLFEQRHYYRGWTVERALSTPARSYGK